MPVAQRRARRVGDHKPGARRAGIVVGSVCRFCHRPQLPRDHGGERAHGRGRAEGVVGRRRHAFRRRRRRRPDPGWGKPSQPLERGERRETFAHRSDWVGTRGGGRDVALVQLDERTHRRDGHSVHERRVDGSRLAEERPELTRRRQGGRGRGAPAEHEQRGVHSGVGLVAADPTRSRRTPRRDRERHLRLRRIRVAPEANARAPGEQNDGGGGLTQALDEPPRVHETRRVSRTLGGVVVSVPDLEPATLRSRVRQVFQEQRRDRFGFPIVFRFSENARRAIVVGVDHRARQSVRGARAVPGAGAEKRRKRRKRARGATGRRKTGGSLRTVLTVLLLLRAARHAPRDRPERVLRVITSVSGWKKRTVRRRGPRREREETRVVRGAGRDVARRRERRRERGCEPSEETSARLRGDRFRVTELGDAVSVLDVREDARQEGALDARRRRGRVRAGKAQTERRRNGVRVETRALRGGPGEEDGPPRVAARRVIQRRQQDAHEVLEESVEGLFVVFVVPAYARRRRRILGGPERARLEPVVRANVTVNGTERTHVRREERGGEDASFDRVAGQSCPRASRVGVRLVDHDRRRAVHGRLALVRVLVKRVRARLRGAARQQTPVRANRRGDGALDVPARRGGGVSPCRCLARHCQPKHRRREGLVHPALAKDALRRGRVLSLEVVAQRGDHRIRRARGQVPREPARAPLVRAAGRGVRRPEPRGDAVARVFFRAESPEVARDVPREPLEDARGARGGFGAVAPLGGAGCGVRQGRPRQHRRDRRARLRAAQPPRRNLSAEPAGVHAAAARDGRNVLVLDKRAIRARGTGVV